MFNKTETIIKTLTTKDGHRAIIKEINNPLLIHNKRYMVTIYIKGYKDRVICGWTGTDRQDTIKKCQEWTHRQELANFIYPIVHSLNA